MNINSLYELRNTLQEFLKTSSFGKLPLSIKKKIQEAETPQAKKKIEHNYLSRLHGETAKGVESGPSMVAHSHSSQAHSSSSKAWGLDHNKTSLDEKIKHHSDAAKAHDRAATSHANAHRNKNKVLTHSDKIDTHKKLHKEHMEELSNLKSLKPKKEPYKPSETDFRSKTPSKKQVEKFQKGQKKLYKNFKPDEDRKHLL